MLIGLMPNGKHSLFFVAGRTCDQQQIDDYIAAWTQDPFLIIALAETWMINGTDQWYLAPSVWLNIPENRQSVLLNGIMSCDQNIGQKSELSIFDELRKQMLSEIKCSSKFAEMEQRKMN